MVAVATALAIALAAPQRTPRSADLVAALQTAVPERIRGPKDARAGKRRTAFWVGQRLLLMLGFSFRPAADNPPPYQIHRNTKQNDDQPRPSILRFVTQ